MKHRWLIAVLIAGFACAAASPLRAADLKLGYIDSERIFREYKGTQAAQQQFDLDVQEWNQQAQTYKKEIERLRLELEGQGPMLSEERRVERESELQTKLNQYDQFVQSIWGPSGLIAQRNEELTRPIIAKIKTVLNKIGSDEGFSIIFDAADGNIVFGNEEFDLTDRVLASLNQGE
jgi:outer membrane protein